VHPNVSTPIRVLRVYHEGLGPAHQAREYALAASDVAVTLVVPAGWPGDPHEAESKRPFPIHALSVERPGDINRHEYRDLAAIESVIAAARPDILDVHEEPYSLAARQWLAAAPADLPIVMYTAQNIDKRLPQPFSQYERRAHSRIAALYPCSSQAASVARGKGFSGHIEVLPLGYDDGVFKAGSQGPEDEEIVLALLGRLVPEKGVLDAVRIIARVSSKRQCRLLIVGRGPERRSAFELAASLGVTECVEILPWLPAEDLAAMYRRAHIVLIPSRPTDTWVEQFGRVIVEGQASGAIAAGYRSGSIPEVGGEAALLADVGDEQGLARRIEALLQDSDAFARRRAQGLAQTKLLTWQEIGQRHANLYGRVLGGGLTRMTLAHSPALRRAAARREFGPTAATTAGERPFALPMLRRGGWIATSTAAVLDASAELVARYRGS
jgi:glycosyltransferase involved in cell wall biosynthesis